MLLLATPLARRPLAGAMRRLMVWLLVGAALAAGVENRLLAQTLAEPTVEATPETTETNSESANTNAPAKPAETALPNQLAGPDTVIWIDDQGTPRPVLGVTYEEFTRAWKLLQGLDTPEATPRYTLTSIDAQGTAQQDAIRLKVRFAIRLAEGGRLSEDGQAEPAMVGVPLGMPGAILVESSPKQFAAGEFLAYANEEGGYVAWLKAESASKKADDQPNQRQIEITVLVPLSRDGARTGLSLTMPRATQSQLAIDPGSRVSAPLVSDGALLEEDRTAVGNSLLKLRGVVGPIEVSWRLPTAGPTRRQTVLTATGQIAAEIDRRSVRTTATLQIESLSGTFDRVRVRLPRGATLLPSPAADSDAAAVRVTLLDEASELPAELEEIEAPAEADQTQAAPNKQTNGKLCLVTRAQRSSRPMTVRLATEQPVGGEAETMDLAGFEVLGAVRQSGDVAIQVGEGVQLEWKERTGAQRIDIEELPETLGQSDLVAAVRYYQQPWTLGVSVVRRETEIEATPRYRLEILPDEARLRVDVDYRITGDRAFEFAFDLNGWTQLTSDPIGPVGLVDTQRQRQERSGEQLIVPLTRPVSRRAEITFQTRRPLETGANGPIAFQLPLPKADLVGVAQLVVIVDPSLELIVDPNELVSLKPVPLSDADLTDVDPTGLHTLAYRGFNSDLFGLKFAAQKRTRQGELTVASSVVAAVDPTQTLLSQQLRYDAKYQPVSEVWLTAPAELAQLLAEALPGELTLENGTFTNGAPEDEGGIRVEMLSDNSDTGRAESIPLRVQWIDQSGLDQLVPASPSETLPADSTLVDSPTEALTPKASTAQSSTPDNSASEAATSDVPKPPPYAASESPEQPVAAPKTIASRTVRIALARPVIGPFELQLRYRVPTGTADGPTFAVPLLMPRQARLETQQAEIQSPAGVRLLLSQQDTVWQTATVSNGVTNGMGNGASNEPLRLVATKPSAAIQLTVGQLEQEQAPTAIVTQAWYQTWDAGGSRQSLAVFRFTSSSNELVIELPEAIDPRQVALMLDGNQVGSVDRQSGRLVIRRARLTANEEHTLQVRYIEPIASPNQFNIRLESASLLGQTTWTDCYWQVIQPASRHVLSGPAGMSPAYHWQWQRGFWGRQPLRTTEQLAEWIGVKPSLIPSGSEHAALFSTRGLPPEGATVQSISRVSAVLGCSAGALLLAFAMARFQLWRRRELLFGLLLAIAALGTLYPGMLLLIAQAGAIGLVLATLAMLAEVLLRDRSKPAALVLSSQSTSLSLPQEMIRGTGQPKEDKEPVAPTVSTNAPTVSIREAGSN